MKKPFSFLLIFFLLNTFINIYAQNISNLKPTFFTLHNARFSFGLGVDGALSSMTIKANKPNDMPVTYTDPTKDSSAISYYAIGLNFDLYSPNSLLGLSLGGKYSFSDLTISDKSKVKYDYFSINKVEIPANIMIRLGNIDAAEHLIIMLGVVYNFPIKGNRILMTRNYGSSYKVNSTDNSISQFKPYYSLSASLGIEFFENKKNNSRITAYVNCDYPIGNTLNADYKEFKSGGNGTLANFDSFQISQFRIGFGLRYFIGFRKYKA